MVHAILGICLHAKRKGRGSDSQDRMDRKMSYQTRVNPKLSRSCQWYDHNIWFPRFTKIIIPNQYVMFLL